MKLGRLATALLLLTASTAWAQDFEILSSTGIGSASTPADAFSLSQRLDGTYSVPFDLLGGGFTLKTHVAGGYPLYGNADVDQLSVALVFRDPAPDLKRLVWTLGRFTISDSTGLIVNHASDGFGLDFDFGGLSLAIQSGFTGLVLRSSSGVSLTRADESESDNLLASPRFLASVTAETSFGDHKVSFAALAQQDLHDRKKLVEEWSTESKADNGGALDTQYLTLQADGPVSQGVFYQVFATFGSGSTLSYINSPALGIQRYEYKPIVSFLAGGELSYFLPEFLSSAFSARILAASGDSDSKSAVEGNEEGWSTAFVPVTGTSLGTVFNPVLSNLIYYELGASVKPLPALPLTAGAKVLGFQRAAAGVVNAPGVERLGPVWIGQEVDLNVTWKPLSDLSASASVGAFIPTAGTFAPGTPGAEFQYAVKVGVTLSL